MCSCYLKRIFSFLLIYFLNSSNAFAQSLQQQSLQKIDEENGLSDNNIKCIFKDRKGFMWIGTASGLNLLDGSTITVFKNIPGDINSINNNSINCITEDSSGLLWVGTQEGLSSFNPALRNFSLIPLHQNVDIENEPVVSITINKKNNLFVATNSGLFFYDQKIKEISSIAIPGDNYEKILNNNITQVRFDKNGLLWLSTFNGLWSYNENTHQFIHEISKKNDPFFTRLFTNFVIDHSGKLWIGTWDKGLKEFDPISKKIITHAFPTGKYFNIESIAEARPTDSSWCIMVNYNSLWFDIHQNKFITSSNYQNNQIPATVLFSSDNNLIWIGTGKGLYFYNPSKNFIRHRQFKVPITGQGVSLMEWGNKILVGGSDKYFLTAYNENLDEITSYKNPLNEKQVSCLSIQSSGINTVKCGTSEGIADINLLTHAIHFHQLTDEPIKKPTLNFITFLLMDSNKDWWIFPWRNGIWITDSATRQTKEVFNNFISQYNVPKSLVISGACEDKNKNFWFSDYDEGIIFYNRNTHQFSKPFIKQLGKRNSISQILYDSGYCYSFTETSLLMWNVDSSQLKIIRLSPQMDKAITSIALDSTGHLWIATQNGLIAYNLKKKIFSHFTTSDGLLSNKMNGTLYCCKDGTMIFGCPEFLSSFNSEEMLESINEIPHIQLAEVLVDKVPYTFKTSDKEYFNHTVHSFIFKWAITDYNAPLNNRYFYQLQGIDKEWHSVGKVGQVEFANLSPGNYTLLLKGENSNGVGADRVLQLQFTIRLPFWRTWWFLSILFCVIAAFFYVLYRYRINQLIKIEKLRNKISLNLHDDIGSTLSSISILSDIALHREKDPEAENMLAEIKENSIALMERMDDIVWSINPRNDSLESLILRVQSFASKLFEAKEINYKIHISEDIHNIHVKMEFRQHIYLIMKEAIINLVKYSGCTEAMINVTWQATTLTIIIHDNGKGFDISQSSYGNGLNSMRKRAKEIKAQIDIQSKRNEGTTVTLKARIK